MAESMVDSGITTISLTFGSNVVESIGGLLEKRLRPGKTMNTYDEGVHAGT